MAGSIIVSEETLIPLSTMGLYYLIERIRLEFDEEDEAFKSEIYETLDKQGMPFIVLRGQDRKRFNAFARATKRAYDKEHHETSFSELLWGNLTRKLTSDPRYAGDIF